MKNKEACSMYINGSENIRKILPFLVIALLVGSSFTLVEAQVDQVPPDGEEIIEEEGRELLDDIDQLITDHDPTEGDLPTTGQLKIHGSVSALAEKLDAYKAQFDAGAIEKVPMADVSLDDIQIEEGFLPNKTLVHGTPLLEKLGLSDLTTDPNACLEVTPDGGTLSTTFSVSAECSTDPLTATRDLEIRWDWEGDGLWDTPWSLTKTSSHTYATAGDKDITVEVRNDNDFSETATRTVHVSGPPTSCFSVSPSSGTTSTTFRTDASCSNDDQTPEAQLQVRWDWEDDGSWDTTWTTTKTANHKYSREGTETIRLQVKDESQLTDTTTKTVTVTSSGGGGGGGGGGGDDCTPEGSDGGEGSDTSADSSGSKSTNTQDGAQTACNGSGTTSSDQSSEAVMDSLPGDDILDKVPVLFERLNGSIEEALPPEVSYNPGERLRLTPVTPTASAMVDHQWLSREFGTYGSPEPFSMETHEGVQYALTVDSLILTGSQDAFFPVVLGQSDAYTVGHRDMVRLGDRAMAIDFVEYPGWVTATHSRTLPNATLEETGDHWRSRLAIDFTSEDNSGQNVHVNRAWLEGLHLVTPRFTHEDGSRIPYTATETHYILEPAHSSTIYAENFDDSLAQGWTLTGLWHFTRSSCTNSPSGSYYLAYNQDSTCTYNTGSTNSGGAVFNVDLAGALNPKLQFYHKWDTESYSSSYDVMRVQISTNGGSSWSTLAHWDSNSSKQPSWNFQSISLFAYTGGTVKIRFHLDTVDSSYNDFLGWIIDSIKVTGTATSNNPPMASFTVSPSSGTTSTTFIVDASGSSDPETSSGNLEVRWDWENDGSYDTSWSTTKTASHSYSSTGTKTIRLQVRDAGGLTDTTTKTVSVSLSDEDSMTMSGGGSLTIRDDDGGRDFSRTLDYTDDKYVKRLVLPSDALTGATSAQLWVQARSDKCDMAGDAHRLTANSVSVLDFNGCNVWSSFVYEWKSLNIPLSKLDAGQTNSFEIEEIAGDWTDRNIRFGIDTDNDYGRSTITHNGASYSGELMWYLVISKSGSTNSPPVAAFTVNPSSGTTSTTFQVDASSSNDDNTPSGSLQVRWDWENDGSYDTSWSTTKTASHVYSSPGSKTIRLQVKDGAGLTSTSTKTVSVSSDTAESGLDADFESGTSGWSLSGLWRRTFCNSSGGSYSLGYNTGPCSSADYDVGTTSGSATSPIFTVLIDSPVLTFDSWHQTEGGKTWDKKLVQISNDGGSSWSTLRQIVGDMREWTGHSIPLDNYAGEDVQLRFRFASGDGLYNHYEGWYVDDVVVEKEEENVLHTSTWHISTVKSDRITKYKRHGGDATIGYLVNSPDDVATQWLDTGDANSIQNLHLWMYAKSSSCTNDLTHEFLVNDVLYTTFSTCKWSQYQYRWEMFKIPGYVLQDGVNKFTVRGTCGSCTAGVYFAADGNMPGSYSDIKINGAPESGEMYWEGIAFRPKTMDSLERYVTLETTDENGNKKYEHVQEAFLFHSRYYMDTVFVQQREKSDGEKTWLGSNIKFHKRSEYNSQEKRNGWSHKVFDPEQTSSPSGGSSGPTTGDFYTWFTTEWEALTHSGGSPIIEQGRYVQLVPSDPGSVSDKDGRGQNPPPAGTDSDPEPEWEDTKFQLTAQFWVKTCETKPYKHKFWGSDDSHPHDCFRLGINAINWNERTQNLADASAQMNAILDWLMPLVNDLKIGDWAKKSMKIASQGPGVSWFFAMVQSGDLASINLNELDRPFPFTSKQVPWSVFSMVPPVIGWQLPFDPQLPGHYLPWNGALNVHWEKELTPSW